MRQPNLHGLIFSLHIHGLIHYNKSMPKESPCPFLEPKPFLICKYRYTQAFLLHYYNILVILSSSLLSILHAKDHQVKVRFRQFLLFVLQYVNSYIFTYFSVTIFIPAEVPIRSTPASIYCNAISLSRIPPEALIFILSPMVSRIKLTSANVAP